MLLEISSGNDVTLRDSYCNGFVKYSSNMERLSLIDLLTITKGPFY